MAVEYAVKTFLIWRQSNVVPRGFSLLQIEQLMKADEYVISVVVF